DQGADGGLLGVGLQVRPARLLRHPEHVFCQVCVAVLGGGRVFGEQCLVPGLLAVGDVLEEDEPQHHVLVVGRLHVAAQLVGGLEEFGLEAQGGPVAVLGDLVLCHAVVVLCVMLLLLSGNSPTLGVLARVRCAKRLKTQANPCSTVGEPSPDSMVRRFWSANSAASIWWGLRSTEASKSAVERRSMPEAARRMRSWA